MKLKQKSVFSAVLILLLTGVGFYAGNYCSRYQKTIQATTTDRQENRIMATGALMPGLEAVYILDQSTGRLAAGVLHRETQSFQGLYETNISVELARILQANNAGGLMPQHPKYTMVTGDFPTPRIAGSDWQVPQSVIYVHELNTGYVMVFAVPWVREDWAGGNARSGGFVLWSCQQFFNPAQ
ncbi:MAG: hypothetical protein LBQ54_01250 [Planctomycetaceae bacterium]|jgi:hypothetical protein|nr:hypothetical protein [Planctomycetaceae bacterium]